MQTLDDIAMLKRSQPDTFAISRLLKGLRSVLIYDAKLRKVQYVLKMRLATPPFLFYLIPVPPSGSALGAALNESSSSQEIALATRFHPRHHLKSFGVR